MEIDANDHQDCQEAGSQPPARVEHAGWQAGAARCRGLVHGHVELPAGACPGLLVDGRAKGVAAHGHRARLDAG